MTFGSWVLSQHDGRVPSAGEMDEMHVSREIRNIKETRRSFRASPTKIQNFFSEFQ